MRNQLVNKFIHNSGERKKTTNSTKEETLVYFDLPYIGPAAGENTVKTFKKKIQRLLNPSKRYGSNNFQNS